jgi:hypothetical protein
VTSFFGLTDAYFADVSLRAAVRARSSFVSDGVVTAAEFDVFDRLKRYDPLLVAGLLTLPEPLAGFVRDLSTARSDLVRMASVNLFESAGMRSSKFNPGGWPAEVKVAAAGVFPLLLENFRVVRNASGQGSHTVTYARDFDDILDEAGVYAGSGVFSKARAAHDLTDPAVRRRQYWDVLNTPEAAFREFFLKKAAWHVLASADNLIPIEFKLMTPEAINRLYAADTESRQGDRGVSLGRNKSTFIYPRTAGLTDTVTVMTDVFRIRSTCNLNNGSNEQLEDLLCLSQYATRNATGWRRLSDPDSRFIPTYTDCFPRLPVMPTAACALFLKQVTNQLAASTVVAYMAVLGIPGEEFQTDGNDSARVWIDLPGQPGVPHRLLGSDWNTSDSGAFVRE